MAVSKPAMGVLMHTLNPCYRANRRRKPTRIIIHSTGANNPYIKRYAGPDDGIIGKNQYGNHWNREYKDNPNSAKLGNVIIGKLEDGSVAIYQTAPFDLRPWLSGSGKNGNGNDTAFQFETCQDFGASSPKGTAKKEYYDAVRAKWVHLCAWICQEYGIAVKNVIDHREAHAQGIASNHGDIRSWMVLFGDTMDKLRADIAAMLDGKVKPPAEILPPKPPTPEPKPEDVIATAVQTGSGGLNLREGPGTAHKSIGSIPRYAALDVYEINGTWTRVRYAKITGWCSANYLTLDFADVDPEIPDVETEAVYGYAVQTGSAGLNIRTGAGTGYASLGLIRRNADLTVYELKGTWARVQWGNIQGWCSAKYLTITKGENKERG